MKSLFRLLCLTLLLALCFPALADAPYKPSDIQAALSQHDYATADREIQAVLVAAPTSAVAHYWAAKVLIDEHHAGQALVEVQKAQSLPAPHFKDPAKLIAFHADLDKASGDLQKTISDEETALAHPQVTTTVTKKIIPMHTAIAMSAPMRPHAYFSDLQVLLVLSSLVLLAILVIILVKVLSTPKAETVRVVHLTDQMDGREPSGSYGIGGGVHSSASPSRYAPPPRNYSNPSAGGGAPVSSGHSTGALVGTGLGGLAAGVLLDEALHNHNNGGFGNNGMGNGFGNNGGFGNQGGVEEIDTTTTTTTYNDEPVQQDYQQDSQDLSSNDTDDNFGSSDDGGGGGGDDNSFD